MQVPYKLFNVTTNNGFEVFITTADYTHAVKDVSPTMTTYMQTKIEYDHTKGQKRVIMVNSVVQEDEGWKPLTYFNFAGTLTELQKYTNVSGQMINGVYNTRSENQVLVNTRYGVKRTIPTLAYSEIMVAFNGYKWQDELTYDQCYNNCTAGFYSFCPLTWGEVMTGVVPPGGWGDVTPLRIRNCSVSGAGVAQHGFYYTP